MTDYEFMDLVVKTIQMLVLFDISWSLRKMIFTDEMIVTQFRGAPPEAPHYD